MIILLCIFFFFFFNDTATTEIYTLSLHDALPISSKPRRFLCFRNSMKETRTSSKRNPPPPGTFTAEKSSSAMTSDRKSTRLNSSHDQISYAVFCLKKKKQKHHDSHVDIHKQ